MAKVFLSPSNQYDNKYAYGNTTEGVQCGKIAEACKAALERSGVTVKLMHDESMQEKCQASNAFNGTVSGTRMFCFNSSGKGMKACKAIFNHLAPVTPGTSENIRVDSSLYEVRVPAAPTAYIECEFHDNPTASKWIVTFKEPEQPKPSKDGRLYRVQVGAFSVKENAEKMLARLKEAGFEGYIRE